MKWLCIKVVLVVLGWEIPANAKSFQYADVCEQACQLAAQTYLPSSNVIATELANLSYDQMRAIEFRRDKALWGQERLPFRIEFFHPGGLHRDIVAIHQIAGEQTVPIPFSPDLFLYPSNKIPTANIPGFTGIRILTTDQSREIAAFQDASYFRMVGTGQTYGTSARGLALNTTQLGHEEFPVFRQFWLGKPSKRDEQIVILALMDSPSVTGAFQFTIRSGKAVRAIVNATFFPRREVAEFGIAPLTSMFWFDENNRQPQQDFRPEVHDADGLLIHTSKEEWIWRPLESGKMARFNAYSDKEVRGFGLLQRDRDFNRYSDLEAKYHKRPSVWVKPIGTWGPGAIKLVQLATQTEFTDNIVAYWVPATPPLSGKSLAVNYELEWSTNRFTPESLGQVSSTRVSMIPERDPATLRFVIEFEGAELHRINPTQLVPVIQGKAKLLNQAVIYNEFNQMQRLVLEIAVPGSATDLSAHLKYRGQPITETWNYTWQP